MRIDFRLGLTLLKIECYVDVFKQNVIISRLTFKYNIKVVGYSSQTHKSRGKQSFLALTEWIEVIELT